MKCKVCGFILYGAYFFYDNYITICSQTSHVGGGKIYLDKDFDSKNINIDNIINKRESYYELFKSGKILPNCEGCMDLKKGDCSEEIPKLKILIFQHWTKCNSNCMYCFTAEDKKSFNKRKSYEIYPLLKQLLQRNALDKNGMANFSGGEITCLREFDKVVKLLEKLNYYIVINSSGVEYSRTIESRLKKGSSCIIISVDSGCKETFEKIKRVKTYDKVWKNIKKYASKQCLKHLVNVKYIIIPGVNDNEEEIDLWLEKCIDANVHNVVLEIEASYFEANRNNIPERIFYLFNTTKDKAEKFGLSFYIANRATTMLTIGKYANEFWQKYRYDEGPWMDLYLEGNSI